MMKKVTIENTRGIRHLEFELPEQRGVYLLVGPNGAGKSTLLAVLNRIKQPNAFALAFREPQENTKTDSYKDSSITYDTGKSAVTYHRTKKGWEPTSRIGCQAILDGFGYSETFFITADSHRISPKAAEIREGALVDVPDDLKENLNNLFLTGRFCLLKELKVRQQGRGKKHIPFYVIEDSGMRFSEKRFSTGELAIIHLLESLREVKDGSLVLIDEAELALHPNVQCRLLKFLEGLSEEKRLTVIISTHSTTMIRMVDKYQILLLSEMNEKKGHLTVVTPCFPSLAIGEVEAFQYIDADAIFYVEDKMAKLILQHMLERYKQNNKIYQHFRYQIIPVGGFAGTAKLALCSKKLLPPHSRIVAVLDQDVNDDPKQQSNQELQDVIKEDPKIVQYLGCTPEVAIMKKLECCEVHICKQLNSRFRVQIEDTFRHSTYKKVGDNIHDRRLAKENFEKVIGQIKAHTDMNDEEVERTLVDTVIDEILIRMDFMKIAGKIITATK